ncbi:hypothetical protein C2G38_2040258 [Gigaspora rosea]|uniref:Uncharacterized protein n=1 Tax=Gigaspora rosea TaxID=44941 RepID=A0A397UX90_9GLOM|nr:hypothetical protein C2G38_2040258 [Gigaspora rosea]
MKYAKEKGFTWKRSIEDNEIVGHISSVEVNVASVKVVQKFHVKHGLCCDVILGIPWVAKTKCSFELKNIKCCCTIRSSYDEMMFVILKEAIIDENVVDKDCVMKKRNYNGRVNDVVDVRSIRNVLKKGKTKDRIKVKDENIDNEVTKRGIDVHMNN